MEQTLVTEKPFAKYKTEIFPSNSEYHPSYLGLAGLM